jgi:glycosyltransferase involved in cell wall biosynthesis
MRILYLTNGYPPRQNAGTETYTAGIATRFARRGVEARVVCGGDWDSGPSSFNGIAVSEHEGVEVQRLNLNWTIGSNPNRALYYNSRIAEVVGELLEMHRPDVVHVTSCYTLSASVLQAVKRQGYPLVITLTDFWFLCPRVSLLRSDGVVCDSHTSAWTCLKCSMAESGLFQRYLHFLPEAIGRPLLTTISQTPLLARQRGFRGLALDMQERKPLLIRLLDLADVVIAPSKFLAQMYSPHLPQKSIQVVEYGHDLDWVTGVRRPVGGLPVFGFVGRLTHSKGAHIFAAALRNLGQEIGIEGVIWGDPEQEPEYMQTVRETITPQTPVRFCGKFGRAEIGSVYGAIDVLVVPSLWYENNPLVIQEAFAAGVPVIASNLGGMAEFVQHGENGLLFEPGNVADLERSMRRFVDEPELLGRLQRNLPRVKTVEEEVDVLSAIYADLAQPKQGGAPSHAT